MSRRSSALRFVLAGAFCALLGAVEVACPSRDLVVQVTEAGAETLVVACESFHTACDSVSCHVNRLLCDPGTCTLREVCDAGGNPMWRPEEAMGFKLLLLGASNGGVSVENESACLPLNLRPCIYDPLFKDGCAGASVNVDGCIAAAISTQMDAALAGGMSFSGFTSTDDVALVAAFYDAPGQPQSCDATITVDPGACAVGNLTAVAGLAAPIGRNTYDITCASCAGGTLTSYGPDNAPCPVNNGVCFLNSVIAALTAAGDP